MIRLKNTEKEKENCDPRTCKEDLMMGLMEILAEEEEKNKKEK